MSTFNSRVTTTADLATSGWIREQYRGRLQYPLAIIAISKMYLHRLKEQWAFSPSTNNCDCIALSDENQTVTHICPLGNHQHNFMCGAMVVSTKGGHYQWLIKVNNLSKKLMFGISNYKIAGETQIRYHAIMFKKKSVNSFIAFSRNEDGTHKQVIGLASEYEQMQKGDVVIVKLRGNHVEYRDIKGDCKVAVRMRIEDGDWRLFVGLGGICDSVSIISYSQTDKVAKCTGKKGTGWCNQELDKKWNYCPKCRRKI